MKINISKNFWIAFIACLILALISIAYRYRIESKNRAVGLAMEMQLIKDYRIADKQPLAIFLEQAKANGLTHIVLSEETLTDKIVTNEVSIIKGKELQTDDEDLAQRIAFAITARTGKNTIATLNSEGLYIFQIENLTYNALKTISLGLNPKDAKLCTSHNLQIIARHSNLPGISDQYIQSILTQSKKLGAQIYLSEGDQILGNKSQIKNTAIILKKLEFDYASPEFSKIIGDDKLSRLLSDHLIRLHSIQLADLHKMMPNTVVERLMKAYRERNVRLLLIRPVTTSTSNASQDFIVLLRTIKKQVEKSAGKTLPPRPFTDPYVPKILFILLGFTIVSLSMYVLRNYMNKSFSISLDLSVRVLLAASCYFPIGRTLIAFLTAIVFPVAAYMTLQNDKKRSIIASFLLISSISLVGGLCIAGILNELEFLIHVKQFSGIKLTHLLPIIIIAFILVLQHMNWKKSLQSPIYWNTALFSLIFLAIVGFMLIRSGNDSPEAVSGLELKIRSVMDAFLYVRPRTKEFLFGHPLLWLGLSLLLLKPHRIQPENITKLKNWAIICLILGVIGQSSIINTFCHLHTPLLVSISRILIGLILGAMIGSILTCIIKCVFNLQNK